MPISNLIIPNILNRIRSLNRYDEDDIDMMRYSLQAFLWETEKIIVLFIAFTLMGQRNAFLLTLLALMTIRVNAGGYHAKSTLGCLVYTFFLFFFAIVILPLIPLNTAVLCSVIGFSLLVTSCIAPICSEERQSLIKTKKSTGKILALTVSLGWLTWICLFRENIYASPVLWMIFLQNAQLLFEYLRRKWLGIEIK